MASTTYDGSLELPRKLTDEEQRELRIVLVPYFHVSDGSEGLGPEDISDFLDYAFAMISNQKSVDYVMQELQGMEDFCPPSVAEKVGRALSDFVKSINDKEGPGEGGDGGNMKSPTGKEGNTSARVVSLKHSADDGENALTMSGALGASRQSGKSNASNNGSSKNSINNRGSKERDTPKNDRGGKDVMNRKDGKRQDRSNQSQNDHHQQQQQTRQPNRDRGGRGGPRDQDRVPPPRHGDRGGRGGRGAGGRASIHRDAFDRLASRTIRNEREGRGERRHDDYEANGYDRRRDSVGARDDRGGGRAGRGGGAHRGREPILASPMPIVRGGDPMRGRGRDMGNRGGRALPGPRGRDPGHGGRMSGNRRVRDDYDEHQEIIHFEGGRGRGRGDVSAGYGGPGGYKRPRYEQQYDEGYNEGYNDDGYGIGYGDYGEGYSDGGGYHSSPSPAGRGRGRFGRGGRGHSGRGGGRGHGYPHEGSNAEAPEGDGAQSSEDVVTHQAPDNTVDHPSPIVQASSGGRGRGVYGYPYGGRGRFARGGRGRTFPGRADVVTMIQSKTWVRKKDGDGGSAPESAAEV